MQHKSVPLLIKSADDQSGLSQKPTSASAGRTHRHRTDFKNGSVGFCDQRSQVAGKQHIACKAAVSGVASTVPGRLGYGLRTPRSRPFRVLA
jgi:hypothetical protein